jgi:acyl carrier protein
MNDKIVEVMSEVFEVSPEEITKQSSQDNIENWDSLHHVKMIVMLEKKFDISIPDEKVGNMISYKIIESVINECLGF